MGGNDLLPEEEMVQWSYDGLSIRMMTSGLPGGVPDICSDVPNAVLKETLLPQGIQLLPYVNDVSKLIRLPQ